MYVQFTDATETTIASVFSTPQPATWPNQGTVTASDARWAAYYATLPASVQATLTPPTAPVSAPLAQQATAQLAAGVAVTFSTSTTLSATYSTTLAAQVKIMAEANWLIKNGTFINGTTTLVLVDAAGTPRSFNPTQFAAFEAAYAPYVSAVDLVSDSNQGTLPAATLTVNA
ncbi:MAG TPA: hypothetical protein VL356_01615 [Acidocella sp.]|jgi:hypothetical protein|nr:hypothetical protein [Acidocella sp.]